MAWGGSVIEQSGGARVRAAAATLGTMFAALLGAGITALVSFASLRRLGPAVGERSRRVLARPSRFVGLLLTTVGVEMVLGGLKKSPPSTGARPPSVDIPASLDDMTPVAAPRPITGIATDPPPKEVPGYATAIDERSEVGGILLRAKGRYAYANVGLLAAGTAYYLLLALFSVMAFAYGVIAVIGADDLAARLTEALSEALPGLVGDEGVDPDTLRSTGRTAGVLGLLVLLYSSLGAVGGASRSMHLIFGAPPDPRNFAVAKVRHLAILLVVGPLVALTFAATSLATDLMTPVLEALGLGSGLGRAAVTTGSLVLGFGLDTLILWILLGALGGIRPHNRPRVIAALIGAIGVGVIKQVLDAIVDWAVAKPQYGAFAAPIAVLFVLSLLSQVLYGSAALAGGISDRDVALEDLEATPVVAVGEPDSDTELPEGSEQEPAADGAPPSPRPGGAGPEPDPQGAPTSPRPDLGR